MDFDSRLAQWQALVNGALERSAPRTCQEFVAQAVPDGPVAAFKQSSRTDQPQAGLAPSGRLAPAIQYALSGGKRLRPYIVFSVAEMLGHEARGFLDAACAVECIHTSSLIFDDLPCMDDCRTRRGKPSLHCKFDEATAVLTAVSVLSRGFAHLGENAAALGLASSVTNRALTCLARTVGPCGMAAGQMAELSANASTDLKTIEVANDLKTSSLFVASAQVPAVLAEASERDIHAVGSYAHDLGLAYQITDDILDYPTRGHQSSSDPIADASNKIARKRSDTGRPSLQYAHPGQTVATLLGIDDAAKKARDHISAALAFLDGYGEPAEPLRQLAHYVLSRTD